LVTVHPNQVFGKTDCEGTKKKTIQKSGKCQTNPRGIPVSADRRQSISTRKGKEAILPFLWKEYEKAGFFQQ
jgi:hypothetical protein